MRSTFYTMAVLLLPLLVVSCEQKSDGQNEAVVNIDAAQLSMYREQIKSLSDKAQRIKDANDVKRLQRIYGYYMDEGLWEDVVDLFSDDATLEYARDGIYKGKARIRQYIYALGGGELGLRQGQLNEHFQLMPVITLSDDGNTAKGRWRDINLKGTFGEEALWGEGPHENEYVKENGVWKISKLHWFQTVLVPYHGGWAKSEDVNKGIYASENFPPDSPPSTDYGYWPETFFPPFHFENPIGTYQIPSEGEE